MIPPDDYMHQAPFPRRRPFQRYNYGMNRCDYYEPGYYQPRGYGRAGPREGCSRSRGGRGQGGYRRPNKQAEETKQATDQKEKEVEKGSSDAKAEATTEAADKE